ncbi:hypothetical protein GCM10010149_89120 [Nonomuraea roseoviolacea subsp. roseoviolacea]|uniref:hypothetical protein n=1 Tax=Nonomuraea roseoviolacea TaxID=103837 RepID=UPI0031DBD509
MAELIAGEVWKMAPPDVKGTKRMVLARMAAYANDRRIAWIGIDTLMQETAASRSAVYEAVSWLLGKGFLQEVDPEIIAEERIPYECTVHRITEIEYWDSGCPAPMYRGDIPSPDSGIRSAVQNLESDKKTRNAVRNPRSRPESGLNKYSLPTEESEKSTSYSSESPEALRRAKPSKTQLRREAAKAEDDYDPAKFLFSDEELGIESQPSASGRRGPGPDTGMGLARYFVDAVSRTGAWRGLDIANQQKLAGSLNRWKRQGTAPDFIRTMIDIYAADEGLRNPKAVPWTDFLAQRGVLAAKAEANEKSSYWDRKFAEDPEPETPQSRTPDPIWG